MRAPCEQRSPTASAPGTHSARSPTAHSSCSRATVPCSSMFMMSNCRRTGITGCAQLHCELSLSLRWAASSTKRTTRPEFYIIPRFSCAQFDARKRGVCGFSENKSSLRFRYLVRRGQRPRPTPETSPTFSLSFPSAFLFKYMHFNLLFFAPVH